jgi:Protein of unknown function (DUF3137)
MMDEHSAVVEKFSKKFKLENARFKAPKLALPVGCMVILLLVLVPSALIFLVVGFFFPPVWLFLLGCMATIGLILLLMKSYKSSLAAYQKIDILKHEFKSEVLPLLCSSVYMDVTYSYNKKVAEKYLHESALFSAKFFESTKEIAGEDLFQGTHEGVRFEFSEITHYVEGLTIKTGALLTLVIAVSVWLDINFTNMFRFSDFTSVKSNFRGFFLYADFNKSFSGEVVIESKSSAIVDMVFQKNSLDSIVVENERMNALYSIKCSNAQLGYYVMSPQLIDAIDKITALVGSGLKISIKNGSLYMIAPLERNFFESQAMVNGEITLNSLETIRKELMLIRDLLDSLNLNNRIWTKV